MPAVNLIWRFALFAWLLLGAGLALGEVDVPPLKARVTDLTATLTPQQTSELESLLRDFETRKGSQIAVLMLPSTKPETIEQFAIRVAEQWKLGRKGVDDGVLFLVAKQDRVMRIEVGYGLEGALSDAVAKRIISEVITPYFKQGDFHGGVRAGLERAIKVIDGEPLPPPSAKMSPAAEKDSSFLEDNLWLVLVFILMVAGILRAIFGRFLGGLATGGLTFYIAWLLIGSLVIALIIAFVVFIFAMADSGKGGPYVGGGGGFSGGGGDYSGGGGFSGGGGDFGGGGASGEW